MPPYARIAITIPRPDLAAADRLARQLDRPRSWVIAEAVRRYASAATAEQGLGASRAAQLRADLALSAEQRVRAAEETARVGFLRRPPLGKQILAFDSYADFLEWKRRESAGQ